MNLNIAGLMMLPGVKRFWIEYNANGEEVGIVYEIPEGSLKGKYKRWDITPISGDTTVADRVKFESGNIVDTYP